MNWQAYLDQSLSSEEMAQAMELLKSSPSARAELAALEQFTQQVRQAGLSQTVPLQHLEASLRALRSPKVVQRPSWRLLGAGAVAAVAMAFAARQIISTTVQVPVSPGSVSFAVGNALETHPVTVPSAAANWVKSKTNFDYPTIDLLPMGKLKSAQVASKWVAYDYDVEGHTYVLAMSNSCGTQVLGGKIAKQLDGAILYEGQGIGWKIGKITYYVTGPNRANRFNMAILAANQVLHPKTKQPIFDGSTAAPIDCVPK